MKKAKSGTEQTSSPLHHPQHHSPPTSPRDRTVAISADALLYSVHAGQESVYNGWEGERCFWERFQDGEGEYRIPLTIEERMGKLMGMSSFRSELQR